MRSVVFLFLLLTLAIGCAPTTVKGLRDNHSGSHTFVIDQDYQSVYRNIHTQMKDCYRSSLLLGSANVVDGELYTDIMSGTISFSHDNALYGKGTLLVFDIKNENGSTKVTYYCFHDGWCKVASLAEKWATKSSDKCRPD